MNLIEQLKQVRDLIERGWTQGAFVRDTNQTSIPFPLKDAIKQARTNGLCFCLGGAVAFVEQNPDGPILDELTEALFKALPQSHRDQWRDTGVDPGLKIEALYAWNDDDDRSKGEVLALIDAAIAAEQVPA